MIQFPIIRRVDVREYELFQNDHSKGISHSFRRGVHAVVGINGLGKTTFLSMLYRALLGPFDQSKSDDMGLLGSQHELSAWRNKNFFRDRVSDGAKNATIEIDVEFGSRLLTVRRQLTSLKIEHLALDGDELEASNDAYEEAVVELSGAATFFDFFAILRYLIFFLEDRVELIWDRRSQFDMLRILLFDSAAAKSASEAYDATQIADSRHRNRRAIVGRDRDRLALLEAAAGDSQASQFRALQKAILEAEVKDREQAKRIEGARECIDEAQLRRQKALLDQQEARTALEYEEQAHYKHLFPEIGETAQHVFLNLLSGGGCLVCGSVGGDVSDYLRAKLEEHRCPICNSPNERHEKVTAPADFSRARLRRLKSKVDQLREAANLALADIDSAEKEYDELVARRDEDRGQLRQLRAELNQLGFTELPAEGDIESLRSAVAEGERELERLLADRTAAEGKYRRIVRRQKGAIDRAVKDIRKYFRQYASMVLAERCELNIDKEKRPIGQEGAKFEFPYFEVMMTSGVFDQSATPRATSEAVSESQKEFLDIAFRLALINAVTKGKADAMLVLETPESSLDSLFVSMAGEALRHFSEARERKNVLIASTNLNNEEMLSALLGVHRSPPRERSAADELKLRPREAKPIRAPVVPAKERQSRIINLLELAAPNAALRQHRAYYRALFKKAVGGEQ